MTSSYRPIVRTQALSVPLILSMELEIDDNQLLSQNFTVHIGLANHLYRIHIGLANHLYRIHIGLANHLYRIHIGLANHLYRIRIVLANDLYAHTIYFLVHVSL